MTKVASSLVAGAEMSTFLAPAAMCLAASPAFVKKPVDSMTISTPSAPQGRLAGSRSASAVIGLPLTMMVLSSYAPGGGLGGVGVGRGCVWVGVDKDGVVVVRDGGVEPTGYGVVLEQVGKSLVVGQIVDSNNLNVGTLCEGGAKVVTADPAKTIDTDLYGHKCSCSMCAGALLRWRNGQPVCGCHNGIRKRRTFLLDSSSQQAGALSNHPTAHPERARRSLGGARVHYLDDEDRAGFRGIDAARDRPEVTAVHSSSHGAEAGGGALARRSYGSSSTPAVCAAATASRSDTFDQFTIFQNAAT